MQCLADQVVDDIRAVELGGVDVVDAELDRASQDSARRLWIGGGRAEHVRARQLHRAEADAFDRLLAEEGCVVGGHRLRWCPAGDADRVNQRACGRPQLKRVMRR
jgi:hypothetical protein